MAHRANGPTGYVFRLIRAEDETDVSGTGHVATGHLWPDGSITLKWHTNGSTPANINHYPHLSNMLGIHGHAGKTRVEYVNEAPKGAGELAMLMGDLSYVLGVTLESVEKGIPAKVDGIRKQFGKVLDHVEALKMAA